MVLDREVIESFGWLYRRTRLKDTMIFDGFLDERRCTVSMTFCIRSNWVIIYTTDGAVRFAGEVLNREEFGVLLRQLKIGRKGL